MYTSFSKVNDRFGFETKGSFRCAYSHDSVVVVIASAVLLIWGVLIIVNIVSFFTYLYSGSADMYSTDNITALDQAVAAGDESENGHTMMESFSPGFIGMSVNSIATVFGIFVLVILVAAYIIILTVLHKGQLYDFKANDEQFVITYPLKMHRTVALKYNDVLGVNWTERRFPLTPRCYDIEVSTRSGNYTFRVVLTKLAQANGITETPFNIVRERIGIAENDRFYGV